MDNNNFNGGTPNQQNMQNSMPDMQGMQQNMGMPMNGQPGPMGQLMQPNMGPNMNPNMGPMGPYPQPMMRPPKQPMDPAKKKKIILIVSIVSSVVVVGIALAIILPIVLRVNYSTAYTTAKELKPYIYDIYQSSDCDYVVSYVDSSYTSAKTYNEYIDGCAEVFNTKTDNLVNDLGNTDGVKRNDNIKTQYEKFKTTYASISPNHDDLTAKLSAYKAYHEFVVAKGNLSYSSSDAEITAAANKLIESGNDTLKTYGEGWLEKYSAAASAYRDWKNSSTYFGEKYDIKNNKDTEYKNWVSANEPDIESLYPLSIDNTSKLYSEYGDLYRMISETYELNYNSGSGDCTELLGEVYCE